MRVIFHRSDALYVQVFVVLWHVPVSCFLGLHCLATELTIVDKSLGVVNALHMIPHISPGGSSLVANGAEEKSWWLELAINKLMQLFRVKKASACRCQYQGYFYKSCMYLIPNPSIVMFWEGYPFLFRMTCSPNILGGEQHSSLYSLESHIKTFGANSPTKLADWTCDWPGHVCPCYFSM